MDYNFIDGEVLLLNKPYDWTSTDLVRKVKFIIQNNLRIRKLKVGHAGTLDPLASGLMIICTGKFTKKIESFQGLEKEYIASIKLGETTPSFDLETDVDNTYEYSHITEEQIKDVLNKFQGEIEQMPPVFSAKRVNGKRAYDFARKGEEIELKTSKIKIHAIEILSYLAPVLKIRVSCSKGTYIRSLARDIGVELNNGGHLIGLERTKIGDFNVENADKIEDFEKKIKLCN
ncbi:MAG TPA: tRNA pseudouridine(55) synthase TruB [Bacteroidales bacterium]|nr:MAG: tRNA pseudouridine(55) synthase TruB [Bacteroidetes bacterium GWF2_33_38]OFY75402.1 MAG: tRNA pseudouridine(55) synthase TruB [Bacteroidetes bacterium RIFOXYA12_FULL_33_9]OFY84975.1 MAG: tRNA pseudouridine(55) synthase TruB [Bacteroidetes bacterium RIFOXYA2_FULL_33_7]HBF87440.1 tRNA pseudouridine(55) synthase TruB [Bacteroidales bacterium]